MKSFVSKVTKFSSTFHHFSPLYFQKVLFLNLINQKAASFLILRGSWKGWVGVSENMC